MRFAWVALWVFGCAGDGKDDPPETDGDADTDADSDADTDTDTDVHSAVTTPTTGETGTPGTHPADGQWIGACESSPGTYLYYEYGYDYLWEFDVSLNVSGGTVQGSGDLHLTYEDINYYWGSSADTSVTTAPYTASYYYPIRMQGPIVGDTMSLHFGIDYGSYVYPIPGYEFEWTVAGDAITGEVRDSYGYGIALQCTLARQ